MDVRKQMQHVFVILFWNHRLRLFRYGLLQKLLFLVHFLFRLIAILLASFEPLQHFFRHHKCC